MENQGKWKCPETRLIRMRDGHRLARAYRRLVGVGQGGIRTRRCQRSRLFIGLRLVSNPANSGKPGRSPSPALVSMTAIAVFGGRFLFPFLPASEWLFGNGNGWPPSDDGGQRDRLQPAQPIE